MHACMSAFIRYTEILERVERARRAGIFWDEECTHTYTPGLGVFSNVGEQSMAQKKLCLLCCIWVSTQKKWKTLGKSEWVDGMNEWKPEAEENKWKWKERARCLLEPCTCSSPLHTEKFPHFSLLQSSFHLCWFPEIFWVKNKARKVYKFFHGFWSVAVCS